MRLTTVYVLFFAPPINNFVEVKHITKHKHNGDPQSEIACFPIKLPWFSFAPFAAY